MPPPGGGIRVRDGLPSLRNVGLTSLGSSGERGGPSQCRSIAPVEANRVSGP